jgi:site-specific DNA-methyltransferase (adenine-specific)
LPDFEDVLAMTVTLRHGDCLDVLASMPDASVDAIVTDPPYELGFMGKAWDGSGIAYNVNLWTEALRVLKPGGHLLAFGGTRTYHRMAVAIEDAGFEIRDSLHWLYGSGFPKSLDVSKAIDKAAGAKREVVGTKTYVNGGGTSYELRMGERVEVEADITAPATDAARQWSGWGTALKPAHEPIVVARKPLTGTVAANVLAHSTGALNIDGCRVAHRSDADRASATPQGRVTSNKAAGAAPDVDDAGRVEVERPDTSGGRWPANLVFTHAADCCQVGTTDVKASGYYPAQRGAGVATGFGAGQPDPTGNRPSGNGDGTETVAVWRCADGCPVAELDGQSGVSKSGTGVTVSSPTALGQNNGWNKHNNRPVEFQNYADTGGASRFFTVTEWDPIADVAPFRYVAKPSKRERNAGLDGLPGKREADRAKADGVGGDNPRNRSNAAKVNHHPTVKPVALMRWLVRLVTPPGGTVLDPFTGSGTTLVAATLEGFDAIGIEMTDDYLPIIEGRVAWAEQQADKMTPTLFDDAGQGVRVTSLAGASIDPTGDATPGQGQV